MSDQVTVSLVEADSGEPLAGVEVRLYSDRDSGWRRIAQRHTDSEGRVLGWPGAQFDKPLGVGDYKLVVDTDELDEERSQARLYPHIDVVLSVDDQGRQYHVAVMVGEAGYAVAINRGNDQRDDL